MTCPWVDQTRSHLLLEYMVQTSLVAADARVDVFRPGKPGLLLNKDGSGVSVGTGVIVTTPVGPLRLEVASKDFSDNWRFNLGVGWKF